MSCLILGSLGSMGKRYQAIFNLINNDYVPNDGYAQQDYHTFDLKEQYWPPIEEIKEASSFIIATPTETHFELILELAKYGKPILCEKPITKKVDELNFILREARSKNWNLQMVNQYAFADTPHGSMGDTFYDYFKHGNDTLAWDCINILGLAKKEVWLGDRSPIWKCCLNGSDIRLSDMDGMYIRMLLAWLRDPKENLDYILEAHNKVINYMEYT